MVCDHIHKIGKMDGHGGWDKSWKLGLWFGWGEEDEGILGSLYLFLL